jgi:predicted nucleic acid-binding protein
MDPASTDIVVADTSVPINLIHVDRTDLLGALDPLRFVVPDAVIAEVTHPEQATELAAALDAGYLYRESGTDPAEVALYLGLRRAFAKGEAAALGMAQSRGWMVACDERGPFVREAAKRLGAGRLTNTPGLMLLAIRRGVLTVGEADELKGLLEEKRFKMRFGSFQDLL